MYKDEYHQLQSRGYIYVILAALLWAVSGSAAKFLFHQGVTPFQVVQIRVTFSSIILFLWLLIRHPSLLKISRKDILYFFLLGSVGMAAVQITYLFAISKINVAAAILIQYMAPSFIALYSFIFAGDRFSKKTIIALIGAAIGCYLVVGAYNFDIFSMNRLGIFSGVLSAIAFAFYSLQGEYGMRRYDPLTVLFFAMLFAALPWNIFYPPMQFLSRSYSAVEWGWIVYIALFGTVIPFGLYFEGINLIRSTRASITATLEPITAGVISYIFLGEIMEPLQIAGGVMVIASVILLQIKSEQDDKAPVSLRQECHHD